MLDGLTSRGANPDRSIPFVPQPQSGRVRVRSRQGRSSLRRLSTPVRDGLDQRLWCLLPGPGVAVRRLQSVRSVASSPSPASFPHTPKVVLTLTSTPPSSASRLRLFCFRIRLWPVRGTRGSAWAVQHQVGVRGPLLWSHPDLHPFPGRSVPRSFSSHSGPVFLFELVWGGRTSHLWRRRGDSR